MKQQLIKELYEYELARKEEIASRGNLLVTGLTLVAGVLGYLTQSYHYSLDFSTCAFLVLITPAFAFYAIAIYCLVNFYKAYKYQVLETPQKLLEHEKELVQYCKEYPSLDTSAERLFDEYLNKIYVECTDTNSRCNDSKAAYQAKAVSILIWALIFSCLASIPYFIQSVSMPKSPQRIEVVLPEKESPNAGRRTGSTPNTAAGNAAGTTSGSSASTSGRPATKGHS